MCVRAGAGCVRLRQREQVGVHNEYIRTHNDIKCVSLPSLGRRARLWSHCPRGYARFIAHSPCVRHRVATVRENGICHYEMFFETPLHCRWVMTASTHQSTHPPTHPINLSLPLAKSICATSKGSTSATTGQQRALSGHAIKSRLSCAHNAMPSHPPEHCGVRSQSAVEGETNDEARTDGQTTGTGKREEL